MKTLEILSGLKDAILDNPTIIGNLNYNDIYEMIYFDIQCRRQLYSDSQMKDIEEYFNNVLSDISLSLKRSNPILLSNTLDILISHIRVLPDSEYVSDFIEQANMAQVRLDHILRKTIYVIGDSHANFFSGNEVLSFVPAGNGINTSKTVSNLPFSVFHMGPCLAYNVNNYNTSYRFREKLDWLLEEVIEPGAEIMFVLGWVDLRAHVFKQSRINNCNYTEVVDGILDNYLRMLKRVAEKGYKVLCFGPISTLSEKIPSDLELSNTGTEVERNKATLYFTNELKKLCKNEGISCFSVLEKLITDDWHTRIDCLCSDGCHLSQTIMPYVLDKVKEVCGKK